MFISANSWAANEAIHIIELGCTAVDIHRRYQEVHGALFGAASLRLIIDALRGKRQDRHKGYVQSSSRPGDELVMLKSQTDAAVLLTYTQVLHKAVSGLEYRRGKPQTRWGVVS